MPASSPKEATTPGQPRITHTDRHVGARIREHRILLGLSQTELAESVGISPQQVYKYEKGQDRVSVGRLYQIAEVLGVEVAHLFPSQGQAPPVALQPCQSMALELSRNVLAIADARHRQLVCYLARALAGDASAEESDAVDMGPVTA